MSDIDSAITMALTVTRANKKPYTVRPLQSQSRDEGGKGTAAAHSKPFAELPPGGDAPAAANITTEQALQLEARCEENNIPIGKVKKLFGVDLLKNITAEQLAEANQMIDVTLANRKASAAV